MNNDLALIMADMDSGYNKEYLLRHILDFYRKIKTISPL